MIDSLKGEMNKSLKEIQEDTNNQCKEINKTFQYLKLEIKKVKKKKANWGNFGNNYNYKHQWHKLLPYKKIQSKWLKEVKKKMTMETDNKLQIKIAKDKNQWN